MNRHPAALTISMPYHMETFTKKLEVKRRIPKIQSTKEMFVKNLNILTTPLNQAILSSL